MCNFVCIYLFIEIIVKHQVYMKCQSVIYVQPVVIS